MPEIRPNSGANSCVSPPTGLAVQGKLAIVYADGGSRGNPGPSGCGAVVKLSDQPTGAENVANLSKFLGITTNNVAEYSGLILGLQKALELGFEAVEVRLDSELVVKQMTGIYRVKNESLQPLFAEAQKLSSKFKKFAILHVRREHNKEADKLANQAMDQGK